MEKNKTQFPKAPPATDANEALNFLLYLYLPYIDVG